MHKIVLKVTLLLPVRFQMPCRPGPPMHCDICQRVFFRKHHLQRHRLLHLGQYSHHCSICQKGFMDVTKLKLHVLSKHSMNYGSKWLFQWNIWRTVKVDFICLSVVYKDLIAINEIWWWKYMKWSWNMSVWSHCRKPSYWYFQYSTFCTCTTLPLSIRCYTKQLAARAAFVGKDVCKSSFQFYIYTSGNSFWTTSE